MKKKCIHAILLGLMAILFINILFIAVPVSHAQSSQIWSNPINLSNAGSSSNPTIVIDAEDTIHVIWMDQFDGYKYTKSTDGKNWTAPKTVRFPFSPVFPLAAETVLDVPVLLADESGGVHALWREASNALYYSTVSVLNDKDLSSGWSTRARLADAVLDFDAVISSQGILHVGYVSNLGRFNNPVGVFYRQKIENNWSTAQNLYFSQYFRSIKTGEANVDLTVSEENELETVYLVWDDRPQKRILWARSLDGGILWESAEQVRGLEDSASLEIPSNINIGMVNGKVLLLWQSGLPGSQCTQYGQWATDAGKQFSPPVKILGETAGCFQSSEPITLNKGLSLLSMNNANDISLVAWDGKSWSKPQSQNEISSFINPATFDSVIFGCQKATVVDARFYVVGCDKGSGGDIWFSSRSLGTVKDWFPTSSAWNPTIEVANVKEEISALSTVADDENNIHMFWIQAMLATESTDNATVQYARWEGESWSTPATIISGLSGIPMQLKAQADSQKRLLLSWVDSQTGDLLFTWAEASRASTASGWEVPQYTPSNSQVNRSPDILVDASGKIFIVYAVPINEQRGIYFVQSDDGGIHWTQPFQIFDAAAAGWDSVDQPDIALTGDGRLHILFKRYSFQGEPRQPLGLYYSQSTNGGGTWSDPETVSDHPIHWSALVAHDQQTLHRLWQEYKQSTLVSFHQISQDGGETWSSAVIVSSLNTSSNLATQTMDSAGDLHFLQLAGEEQPTVFNHIWNGSSWVSQEATDLYTKDEGVPASIVAGISSNGYLSVSLLVEYPTLVSEFKSGILNMGKSFELPDEIATPYPAYIPEIELPVAMATAEGDNFPVSTEDSPLTNLSDARPPISKNLTGFLLLGGILVLIVFVFRPLSKKPGK